MLHKLRAVMVRPERDPIGKWSVEVDETYVGGTTQGEGTHTCKSRFCSSCGKKATDDWIKNSFNTLPDTTWQHITFTLPDAFWELFWINRHLMNQTSAITADIIKQLAKQQGFIPGIYLAIHTFGRDLKRNFHLHLSTTIGGISSSHGSWITGFVSDVELPLFISVLVCLTGH